jgi:hypothetical protein
MFLRGVCFLKASESRGSQDTQNLDAVTAEETSICCSDASATLNTWRVGASILLARFSDTKHVTETQLTYT